MANPIVTIQMKDGGVMKAELYPEIAPITVQNFIDLAAKGFYNGLIFRSRAAIRKAQAWAAPVILSRVSLLLTVSEMTLSTQEAFFPWHVR